MKSGPLKAFESRNYKIYFSGQSLSLIGTWMQRTAVYWLVYDKTGSSIMLGTAVFATQFPSFMLSMFGGVVSDRYNRHKVLLITQIASLIQAVVLTLLVYTGNFEIWHILMLSVILGIINAFDVPARQAMVYDMVDNKDVVPNAIAFNSSMVHLARMVGPALSGIVLEKLGASVCFMINAISFIAVIVSLQLIKLPPYKKPERMVNALTDVRNGFKYLKDTPSISTVMLMLALISLLSLPYTTLLPVYAKEIYNGGPSIFGFLNSLIGLGALTGAIFLASLKTGTNLKKVLFINTLLFGVGLTIFSNLNEITLAVPFLVIIGFGMMSQTTISNTLIQLAVTPSMRGRVISFYAMAFFGLQPVGSLLVGSISHIVGTPTTLLLQGIVTIIIGILFMPFLRERGLRSRDKMKMEQLEERSVEVT